MRAQRLSIESGLELKSPIAEMSSSPLLLGVMLPVCIGDETLATPFCVSNGEGDTPEKAVTAIAG
jgi:hypothetical protein